jgi:HupE / UreJ protein
MKKLFLLMALVCNISLPLLAHTIDYVLEKPSSANIFLSYLQMGFTHILPLGVDHILFIICVFFMNTNIKKIILHASIFTIAHSITLALVVFNIIVPPTAIVEPIIALSIAVLAIENIFFVQARQWRIFLIFAFGLVHGMGFAAAIAELGLPSYDFTNALVSFNIGVEFGQLSIIVMMYFIVQLFFKNKIWYRARVLIPANVVISLIAIYWTIIRIVN